MDNYTKSFDNSVGSTLEMDRQAVDNNREQTCSTGFHGASWDYASTYSGDTLIMIKVNPRDIVAIPKDYNNMKFRCCRYEVMGIIDSEIQAKHLEV